MRRHTLLAGTAAFAVPLAVYLRTLARDVTFIDSGELAAAAATLGIAHPPGYPLFTLLGHLLAQVPAGPVIFRVGLLSALATAAASWLTWRAALGLTAPSRVQPWAALGGALLAAFSLTVWSQAVIVEVYALQAALTMAFVAVALGTWHADLRLLSLLLGLTLVNHLTGVLLAPTFAIAAWLMIRAQGRPWRVLWVLPPLSLYLYLPLRSRLGPALNWDYPETPHRLLVHVTARHYQGFLGLRGLRLPELDRFLSRQLPAEATLILPLLAVLGVVVLARSRPRALWLTAPFVAAVLVYNMAYPIPDIAVYYVPAIMVLGLWASVGAAWLADRAGRRRPATAALAAALLVLTGLVPLARNFKANDLSDFHLASRYVRDALRYADPDAVIISGYWDRFTAPAIYLREIEGLRPDVVIIDSGRMSSPMLGRDLERWFPELAEACRDELQALAAVADRVEHGQLYDRTQAAHAYAALQRALVVESVARRPTYALGGIFQHPMFNGLHQHPEGLLVRMTPDAGYRPFPTPVFEGPGVAPQSLRTPAERETYAEYVRMLDGRVRYLWSHGREDEARALKGS
jgi:hypothetical protein